MIFTPLFIFLTISILGALILGATITAIRGWMWVRFLITSLIVFVIGWTAWYANYRLSATKAFHEDSPDGRFRVVVYRLPNYSMTPGSGGDAPAIVKLFDSNGQLLQQSDLDMIQLAQVEWSEDSVMISDIFWKLEK